MMQQKNSRPAATGTTAKNAESNCSNNQHPHYNTNIAKKQAVLAFIVCSITLIAINILYTQPKSTVSAGVHKVRNGETLWSIARDYKPEGLSFEEHWNWVCQHNESALIYPGDTVKIAEVHYER